MRIDDPLPTVTQDNINVELRIGPEYNFERGNVSAVDREVVKPNDNALRYHIIEGEVELVTGTETNYLKAIVIGDGHNILPSEGDPLDRNDPPDVITLDINNELTESERDSEEITRVFTGVIANASRMTEDRMEFVAFWPGFNQIQDEDITIAPPPPTGYTTGSVDYNPRRQTISEIAQRIGEKLTYNNIFNYRVNVETDGIKIGETPSGRDIINGFDPEITLDSSDVALKELLNDIKLKSESTWYIDRYGDFYFGAIEPNAHKLRYITDTSAGKMSPAWRSVRVIGDGVVSEDGWGSSAMVNENPKAVQGNISDNETDEGLAEPTFVYRNMEINTNTEAQHVMNKLREEIRDQAAGGSVTVVGHPELWTDDAIEMPNTESQPFNLERFGINKITHRLNNSEGFMTKVECGGITNAKKTVFEDTITDIIEARQLDEIVSELRDKGFDLFAELIDRERFDDLREILRENSLYDLENLIQQEKWIKFTNELIRSDIEPEDIE